MHYDILISLLPTWWSPILIHYGKLCIIRAIHYERDHCIDENVSVRWYDAECCVESMSFNIFEHLPVFVLMTLIFQRFTHRVWELEQRNAPNVECCLAPRRSLGRHALASPARPRRTTRTQSSLVETKYQPLRRSARTGKHPGCRDARRLTNPCPPDPKAEPPDLSYPLCSKISWAEASRTKEPDIINTAHERAKALLPGRYCKMVTDHIPEVVASQVFDEETTMDVARLVQLDTKASDRVKVVLVMRRLRPITDLEPVDFWKVFWDINRCACILL